MEQITPGVLIIIDEILSKINQNDNFIDINEILKLKEILGIYTENITEQIKDISSEKKIDFEEWLEVLYDCMQAVENKDKILLKDCLLYGVKPYIINLFE